MSRKAQVKKNVANYRKRLADKGLRRAEIIVPINVTQEELATVSKRLRKKYGL